MWLSVFQHPNRPPVYATQYGRRTSKSPTQADMGLDLSFQFELNARTTIFRLRADRYSAVVNSRGHACALLSGIVGYSLFVRCTWLKIWQWSKWARRRQRRRKEKRVRRRSLWIEETKGRSEPPFGQGPRAAPRSRCPKAASPPCRGTIARPRATMSAR
jgi:hypothetical protein